jgi:phosphatidylserine/phosphatidylglycerophosphate/cardiolipin synthase-like enzyme
VGVAAAGAAWYAADSLRHRRDSGHGYELRGECHPGTEDFLRAAEALTGAPISRGNEVDLLIPCYLETIRSARQTVCLLVPGPHIDMPPVRMAGRAAYEDLLEVGVELYEYQPTMLHAKTMVVDDIWSSVGSVNFDNRSFQLHDEATLCVQSRAFAGELTEHFERDLAVAERIQAGRWRRRGPLHRGQEAALKLVRREL